MGILDAPGLSRSQADALYTPQQTRRAAKVFGCAGTTGYSTLTTIHTRTAFSLPVTTTRWRMRYANYDFRNLAAPPDAGNAIRGIWFGKHLLSASDPAGTGKFTAAPANVVPDPAAAIPIDGSQYVTPWITDPAAQIQAGTEYLIAEAIDNSVAAGSHRLFRSVGASWYNSTLSDAGVASPSMSLLNFVLLDRVLEFEFVTSGDRVQVGVLIGDSLDEGNTSGSSLGCPPPARWTDQWERRSGNILINLGMSGIRATEYANPLRWARVPFANIPVDFAVDMLGTNDADNGTDLATFLAARVSLGATLRSYGARREFSGMLLPRRQPSAKWYYGTLAAAVAAGATSISSSVSFPSGSVITIGDTGGTQETVTTSGAPTGSGPYAIPVPALANAYASGVAVAGQGEALRRVYNRALALGPNGSTPVDFATAVASPTDLNQMRADYGSGDGTHLGIAGNLAKAAAFPTRV